MLERALAGGRQTRLERGDGLDALEANLKIGAQPNLIKFGRYDAKAATLLPVSR
jgi:hypothetical protein